MARGKQRERLLDEGLKLFARRGYVATGVQDLTDASGIPKGSFYNYFRSKDDFAVAVVERYGEAACEGMCQALLTGPGTPLERLRAAFDRQIEEITGSAFSGGCLAGRLAQELAGEQTMFRVPLERIFSRQRKIVAELLAQAVAAGEISPAEDRERLADFLLSAWQGAMLRSKAAGDARPLFEFQEIVFGRLLTSPTNSAA